jgi:hypothetical protein
MQVIDAPAFQWRGVLLDVGRHFFEVTFIMKLLDVCALYKINRFHWHLTEDQVCSQLVLTMALTTYLAFFKSLQVCWPIGAVQGPIWGGTRYKLSVNAMLNKKVTSAMWSGRENARFGSVHVHGAGARSLEGI